MITHELRTYKSAEHLPREGQLAWKIAEVAADPVAEERRNALLALTSLRRNLFQAAPGYVAEAA